MKTNQLLLAIAMLIFLASQVVFADDESVNSTVDVPTVQIDDSEMDSAGPPPDYYIDDAASVETAPSEMEPPVETSEPSSAEAGDDANEAAAVAGTLLEGATQAISEVAGEVYDAAAGVWRASMPISTATPAQDEPLNPDFTGVTSTNDGNNKDEQEIADGVADAVEGTAVGTAAKAIGEAASEGASVAAETIEAGVNAAAAGVAVLLHSTPTAGPEQDSPLDPTYTGPQPLDENDTSAADQTGSDTSSDDAVPTGPLTDDAQVDATSDPTASDETSAQELQDYTTEVNTQSDVDTASPDPTTEDSSASDESTNTGGDPTDDVSDR